MSVSFCCAVKPSLALQRWWDNRRVHAAVGALGIAFAIAFNSFVDTLEEFLHLFFGFVASGAVALLHESGQALGVAFDLEKLVIRELAPSGFGLADQLLPLALDCVLVHVQSPRTDIVTTLPPDSPCQSWLNQN